MHVGSDRQRKNNLLQGSRSTQNWQLNCEFLNFPSIMNFRKFVSVFVYSICLQVLLFTPVTLSEDFKWSDGRYIDDGGDWSVGVIIAVILGNILFVVIMIVLLCYCCACLCFAGRRTNTRGQVYTTTQVITPAQPTYPTQYAGAGQSNTIVVGAIYQPGYPNNQPGYPNNQPGYQPGYPNNQPGYQPGYPNNHQMYYQPQQPTKPQEPGSDYVWSN